MKGGMGMNCKDFQDHLSAYLDCELEASELGSIKDHLANCPACKQELQRLQNVSAQLSSLGEVIPPASFRTDLFAKLEQSQPNEPVNLPETPKKKGFWARLSQRAFGAKAPAALIPVALVLVVLLLASPSLLSLFYSVKWQGGDMVAPEYSVGYGGSSAPEAGYHSPGLTGFFSRDAADEQIALTTEQDTVARSVAPNAVPAPDVGSTAFELNATASSEVLQDRALMQEDGSPAFSVAKTMNEPADGIDRSTEVNEPTEPETSPETGAGEILDRKIIKNANLNLVVDDYDQALNAIREKVLSLNGYIANESESIVDDLGTKRGSLQVRIPQPQFEAFLEGIDALGKMEHKDINARDVTEEFIDITGRLKAMRTKEERLLAILTKSGKLEEILAVEKELAQTRADLESTEGRLRFLTNQTDFSTVTITLKQAVVSTQQVTAGGLKGVGQRAKEGFIEAINNILVGLGKLVVALVTLIPYLVVAVPFIIIIVRAWRKRKRTKANENQA
jgi:hypothetical protein